MIRPILVIFLVLFSIGCTIARAGNLDGFDVPELRYTCTKDAIDIHLYDHATSSEVSKISNLWEGTVVPWEKTILSASDYPKKGKPITLNCVLRSGILYEIKIEGAWHEAQVGSDIYPNITIVSEGKVVLPTTSFGICRVSREAVGDCEKKWAVRIFMGETHEKYGRENKPPGYYASSSVYRVTEGFTDSVKVR